jgi:hypothetical protein
VGDSWTAPVNTTIAAAQAASTPAAIHAGPRDRVRSGPRDRVRAAPRDRDGGSADTNGSADPNAAA